MARMYFHKPKFAILDECTSGVSASMEKRLYESCVENGITCITISHRPVLEQYHDVVLNVLKDGEGGWTFRMTERGRKRVEKGEMKKIEGEDGNNVSNSVSIKSPDLVNSTGYDEIGGVSAAYMADLKGTSKEQGELERKRLTDRSFKYRAIAEQEQEKKDTKANKSKSTALINELNGDDDSDENDGKTKIPISKRFWDVWNRGFMPNGMSMADPEARRILFLMSLVVGKTVAAGGIAYYDGFLLTTVLQSKWSVFFKRISLAVVMRSSLALFDATMTRQKWYVKNKNEAGADVEQKNIHLFIPLFQLFQIIFQFFFNLHLYVTTNNAPFSLLSFIFFSKVFKFDMEKTIDEIHDGYVFYAQLFLRC